MLSATVSHCPLDPNTSEEAKDNAREILETAAQDPSSVPGLEATDRCSVDREEEIHEHRVLGGYKATLKSGFTFLQLLSQSLMFICHVDPNVSEEAKEEAREVLAEHGVDA
jgi:hypothetical protein